MQTSCVKTTGIWDDEKVKFFCILTGSALLTVSMCGLQGSQSPDGWKLDALSVQHMGTLPFIKPVHQGGNIPGDSGDLQGGILPGRKVSSSSKYLAK